MHYSKVMYLKYYVNSLLNLNNSHYCSLSEENVAIKGIYEISRMTRRTCVTSACHENRSRHAGGRERVHTYFVLFI